MAKEQTKTWLDIIKERVTDPEERQIVISAFAQTEARANVLDARLQDEKGKNVSLVSMLIKMSADDTIAQEKQLNERANSHYLWLIDKYRTNLAD